MTDAVITAAIKDALANGKGPYRPNWPVKGDGEGQFKVQTPDGRWVQVIAGSYAGALAKVQAQHEGGEAVGTVDSIDCMAKIIRSAVERYTIEGTRTGTDDNPRGFGTPSHAPYFVIDVSLADPEANWPGEYCGEFVDAKAAVQHRWRLIAEQVLEAVK